MIESLETNEAFSLNEEVPLRLVTLISLILLVPLLMLVFIVQEVSDPEFIVELSELEEGSKTIDVESDSPVSASPHPLKRAKDTRRMVTGRR